MGQSKLKYNIIEECKIEMDKVATNIKEIGNDYCEEIEKIEKNDYWAGNASIKFQNEATKVKELFEDAYTSLQTYVNNLETIIENYKEADKVIINDKEKRRIKDVKTYNAVTTQNTNNTYVSNQIEKKPSVHEVFGNATKIVSASGVIDAATLAVNSVKNIKTYNVMNGATKIIKDAGAIGNMVDYAEKVTTSINKTLNDKNKSKNKYK